MTPAYPFRSEVLEPVGSGAADESSQPKQRRRRQGAARQRPKPQSRDKSALVSWAYDEYHRLREQGRAPDVSQWCTQFPTCRSAVCRMLEVEGYTDTSLDRPQRHPRPNSGDKSIDWPREGERRADFSIIRELGRGAFARVYLATEESTGDRLVVLKCSLHGDAEARTLGRLAHPHIVPILSARRDEQSGLTMVCMPYLGCATLEDVLDHRGAAEGAPPSKATFLLDVLCFCAQPEDPPLPADHRLLRGSYTDSVIRLAVQLAETLAFLHQKGVHHRDLKPSNVLLDPSGEPLLLDFNLSESEREAAVPVGGTLRYMAPEHIRAFLADRKDGIDVRADLYALGVMVYELVGGVHPCTALLAESYRTTQAHAMLANLEGGFRPFREICPDLERPVAAVLDRCLALDASDRPASAADLAAALKRQFTPMRRLRRRLAAHRRSVWATASLLLVAVAGFVNAWAVTPPYSQREYERGRIAYLAGDFDAAESHFDRAFRAERSENPYRHARGCARLQQSKYLPPDQVDFDPIREDLSFTRQGTADMKSLAVFAYTDLRMGRIEAAIKKYDVMLRSGSDYRRIMVLNNRAYCNMSKAEWEKARSDLDRAVELGPPCQAVHYNRVVLALQMHYLGKKQACSSQIRDDMEKALELGPKSSDLCRAAAKFYALAVNEDRADPSVRERAMFYLRQALEAGESPAQFVGFPTLLEALKGPEFVAVLDSHPPQPAPQPNLRLLDPVDLDD